MIIVYTPESGEPEHYDVRSLRVSEASIASRTADMKWGELRAGLENEDLEAMRSIVWVIKKRSTPSLRYGEFDPGVEEMVVRLDRDEVTRWVETSAQIAAAEPDLTAETLAQILNHIPPTALDREHADEQVARAVAEFEEGRPKGAVAESSPDESLTPTSSESEPSTSGSSPTS
ncbi:MULTISPECIES: hypothetical protein [Streptomyces]|uniref:Uncharacterized protein n=2 Tax=Streptomyces TaxID=1883 RepID=A0A100Y630_9ACTN|nr:MULTISPECIES: hypothetical protein [Streptomyces]KUH38382.1 hypothetical protein ATE80_13010 [Streptomyces kanasensis]UUS30827.1 hypothetical protein NRO40_08255 [Streptomyces changanensis]